MVKIRTLVQRMGEFYDSVVSPLEGRIEYGYLEKYRPFGFPGDIWPQHKHYEFISARDNVQRYLEMSGPDFAEIDEKAGIAEIPTFLLWGLRFNDAYDGSHTIALSLKQTIQKNPRDPWDIEITQELEVSGLEYEKQTFDSIDLALEHLKQNITSIPELRKKCIRRDVENGTFFTKLEQAKKYREPSNKLYSESELEYAKSIKRKQKSNPVSENEVREDDS